MEIEKFKLRKEGLVEVVLFGILLFLILPFKPLILSLLSSILIYFLINSKLKIFIYLIRVVIILSSLYFIFTIFIFLCGKNYLTYILIFILVFFLLFLSFKKPKLAIILSVIFLIITFLTFNILKEREKKKILKVAIKEKLEDFELIDLSKSEINKFSNPIGLYFRKLTGEDVKLKEEINWNDIYDETNNSLNLLLSEKPIVFKGEKRNYQDQLKFVKISRAVLVLSDCFIKLKDFQKAEELLKKMSKILMGSF